MATRQAPKHVAPRQDDDSRLPHVHSTNRHDIGTATKGQCQGPWKRYQLQVDNGTITLPEKGSDEGGGIKRPTLDPATRAGCVPATAYPSFRTMPPPPAASNYRRNLPRVSDARFFGYQSAVV